jgi:serine/threonine-protein kinase
MSSDQGIIGRTLANRFRVVGFIGEGAMASVYRAVQAEEPREVALKIMHPRLATDATFAGRFRREARAATKIEHPNTVKIVDFGVDGELLYIAMELLGGQDLFETLVLERRFSEARAARVLVQVTEALTAAHAKGIVHRDLKPENIMLLRDDDDPSGERVKVLDFGIAKILDRDVPSADTGPASAYSALTSVGTVVGTPAYMSPEQCRGDPIDHRSDLYTAGILLYQLVCGRLPFAGDNAMDLAVKHVRTPPTPPEDVVPAIHPGLSALILKALSKWPSQRQQSAEEMRDELRQLMPALSTTPLDLAHAPEPPKASQDAITLPPAPGDGEAPAQQVSELARTLGEGELQAPTIPQPEPSAPELPPRPAASVPPPAPKPVANPLAAPVGGRALAAPRPRKKQSALAGWLIVPLALLIGVAMGVLAFLLARR